MGVYGWALARILPGALLITSGVISFGIIGPELIKEYSSIIVITVGVLCSHYLSILLHEIWLWICLIPKFKEDEERKLKIAEGIAKIGDEEESNIYKINRLMRAAAEIDGAESLIAGYGLLCVSTAVMGSIDYAVAMGIAMILFLFWRNSLIKASESILKSMPNKANSHGKI